jgi:hypothetical protein
VSSVLLGQEQADVLQGGQVVFTQLFETWIGSGQAAPAAGVTIAITAPDTPGAGTGDPLPATSAGLVSVDGANYTYTWIAPAATAPGDYLVTWTGTGGADGATVLTYTQTVTVAAISSGLPAPGQYATPAQYMNWSGDTSTPYQVIMTNLMRASEDLDMALMGAVYTVNGSGQPTDPQVIDVFMRACCAQAQFLIADNDPAGVKRQYSQTNIAGVQATRAKDMQALSLPPLCPRALQILHVSGVVPSAMLIAW